MVFALLCKESVTCKQDFPKVQYSVTGISGAQRGSRGYFVLGTELERGLKVTKSLQFSS